MVDRISLLPDGVISHILSFLPTKEAVATSALSKRWYPLWRSVSALNLTDEFVPDDIAYSLYKEFVLSVLLFRHPAQPIKRFSLVCSYDDDCIDCNLNKWVSVVLQRGVEYLRLLMTNEIHYHKLPVGIFSCKTLRVLKLNSFRVNVNDVSSVELPLLKVLQLKKIQFTQYRFIPELLSGCPNLEEIHATYLRCAWHGREGNFKSLTKLARATIRGRDLKIPLATLNNVEYLNLFLRLFQVSPYFDHMPTFHNLTHAKLYFREYRWQLLVEVLNHCPKLQILFIQQEVASNADENWVSPRFVPECVLSHLKECTIREYGGMRGDLRFARYMLQNAGVLHTMTIHSTSSSNSDTKLQILQELSSCPRSSTACKLFFT